MATRSASKGNSKTSKEVIRFSKEICEKMLKDLERARRPMLQATKCSLDNSIYNPSKGFLVPGDKKVKTELNVSSVKKMSRAIFMLEIMLHNLESGAVKTKRELYYIAKGELKQNKKLKPLAFEDENESNAIISFICEMMECYREDFNCIANDRGGQTYSQQLIVVETLPDGKKATVDLSKLGSLPYMPQNRPQNLKLKTKGKIDFGLIVESEGTAKTLVLNGMTKRNKCIVIGSQGVPSNGVRGWVKTIQDQLKIPLYFFGDLDAYTLQNIYRTLKAGSASSLIRNADYCAPDVKFLGVLPEDVERLDLADYPVKETDVSEVRALKKARDAIKNDPFFQNKKNKKLRDILKWLLKEKRRCEQQSFSMVAPRDPIMPEKIILEKIKKRQYI